MKKILILLLLPCLVLADAAIFSGSDVKILKQNLDLFGVAKILSGSVDPSAGGGIAAPVGSIYMSTTAGMWQKTGAGATAWTKYQLKPVSLTADVSGVLPVTNGGTGVSSFTAGSVIFMDGTTLTEDNSNFFWDATNKRLGIGTNTPTVTLDVHSSTLPVVQVNHTGAQGTSSGGTLQLISDDGSGLLSGNRLGAFQFDSVYDGTHAYSTGAALAAFATENWTSTAQGTQLRFNVTANGTNSRTTAMTINQDSGVNINSSSANALTVGPNGTTNPVLQVDTSTASQDSGVKITGAASGTSSVVSATGSVTNVPLSLSSKGASSVSLQIGGTTRYLMTSFNHTFSMALSSLASNPRFGITGGADTSLTASTEAPSVYFNIGQTRSHSTGNYALQRDFRITPSTHAFAGASTVTTAAGFAVDGAPIAGSNASITNSSSIYTGGVNVGSGVTSSYGAYINANSGATNNYSAVFTGGNVGINTTSPGYRLTIAEGGTDPAASTAGIRITNAPTYTVTNPGTPYTIFGTVNPSVASGQTLSSVIGILSDSGNTNNSGTVTNQYGMQVQFGSKTGSSGSFGNVYGLNVIPYAQAGTINNSYAIFISQTQSGGTVNNSYGIYQADSGAKNYFNGSMGLGITSPAVKLHQDGGTSTATSHKFTAGTTTGQTATDGFDIGITTTGAAEIRQYENLALSLFTNNTQRMQIAAGGGVAIGSSSPTTSAALDIQGTTGAVLLPRLTSAQRNALTATAGMIIYNTDNTQVECYYAAWGPCTSRSNSTQTSLTFLGTISISLEKDRQTILVGTSGGSVTLSSTPFGSSAPLDGTEITLIGNSDTNMPVIPVNDAAKGILGYQVTLGRGQTVTYVYNASLDRYVIKSTSN